MINELRKQLIRQEGRLRYAYKDHLGFWTIGVGRLIDSRKGGGLSDDEIDYLLNNDLSRVIDAVSSAIPFYARLSEPQKQALCNMAFQMGLFGLLKFKGMLSALESFDYERAKSEALDSKWAKQTPERANEIANMLTR